MSKIITKIFHNEFDYNSVQVIVLGRSGLLNEYASSA